jgi:DNA-directed RNA polymerase subunit RPC12/RpoP
MDDLVDDILSEGIPIKCPECSLEHEIPLKELERIKEIQCRCGAKITIDFETSE